jgi:hypothetical protein
MKRLTLQRVSGDRLLCLKGDIHERLDATEIQ